MNRFRIYLCVGLSVWFLILFVFLLAILQRNDSPKVVKIEGEKDISLLEMENFEDLTEDEKDHVMEDKIRVLIKSANYEKTSHENIVIVPDGDCDVYYGEASMSYAAGESITLGKEESAAYTMPLYVRVAKKRPPSLISILALRAVCIKHKISITLPPWYLRILHTFLPIRCRCHSLLKWHCPPSVQIHCPQQMRHPYRRYRQSSW